MNGPFSAGEVLSAMITPAVLISASGTLVLSTSNRLTRVVDRVRTLAAEAERLRAADAGPAAASAKRRHIAGQVPVLTRRALLLRSALTALYTAIGFLVATSIAIGVVAALGGAGQWVPVVTGLAGACLLLWGSLLLVREGRLAIGSTLEEMVFVREEVGLGTTEAEGGRR